MEYVKLSALDNHKLHIDAVAILPRKCTGGGVVGPHMTLGPKEELQTLLYMGSSDGCVTQFTCNVSGGAADGGSKYPVVASQTQKRKITDGVVAPVSFLYVDDQLREPRIIVLCGGKVVMLHYNSLDPLAVFHAVKALDGATACCVAHGWTDGRRLAAVVKRQLVLVEYSEVSCSPVVSTVAQPLMLPENIQQLEWHHNVLICGSKREYILYDVRTNHVVDQIVVDKMNLGAAIRYLPNYNGGTVVIRYGESTMLAYDGKQRQPVDLNAKLAFSEPVVDVGHCHPFLIGIKADGRVLLKSTIDDGEVPVPTHQSGHHHHLSFGATCRLHTACPLLLVAAAGLTLGALVSVPPLATVAMYVRHGAYERALAHYEHFFGLDAGGGEDQVRYYEGLRNTRHACAVHALLHNRHDDAFAFFELAETPPEHIVRAMPELRRPSSTTPLPTTDAHDFNAPLTLSCSSSSMAVPLMTTLGGSHGSGDVTTYRLLFQYLKRHRVSCFESGHATDGQRDVDFAMFSLMLHGNAAFTEDDLNDLFLPTCALNAEECIAMVQRKQQAHGGEGSGHTPEADHEEQPTASAPGQSSGGASLTNSFMSLLLASSGRYADALAQCRQQQLVAEAIVPLQLSGEVKLYLEHMPWMLEANPNTAIRALLSTTAGRAPPSVDSMLPIVMPYSGATLTTYLDHAIHRLRCRDGHLHTVHALNFIDTIRELRAFGLQGFGGGTGASVSPDASVDALRVAPGHESGAMGETRRKFLTFLSSSSAYDADVVIGNLRKIGGLEDELVAAYCACGEHDFALQTLVYNLKDISGAIAYCLDMHAGRPYRWSRRIADDGAGLNNPEDASDATMSMCGGVDNASFGSSQSTSLNPSSFVGGSGTDWMHTSSSGHQLDVNNGSRNFSLGSLAVLPKALGGTGRQGSNVMRGGGVGGLLDATGDSAHIGGVAAATATAVVVGSNEYFNVLLHALLVPPKGEKPRVADALSLLECHADDMNPVSVLESLPGDVAFSEIATYLTTTLRAIAQKRLISSFASQTTRSELGGRQRERMLLLQRCVYIDDDRLCVVCKKRVGDAVFGVFPNLKVAHFRCFKERDVDPERGTTFVSQVL